jgi:hypothetical protein
VSIIAVADIQKQEYIAEEEYTLLEGFDSGKMAGLGLPGFFVTSNTLIEPGSKSKLQQGQEATLPWRRYDHIQRVPKAHLVLLS